MDEKKRQLTLAFFFNMQRNSLKPHSKPSS
jgi:hypothetical protein